MTQTIDARGLSCPQPVILLKKTLDENPQSCELIVDNRTAVENTTRFAESVGYKATVSEVNGEFTLKLTK